MMKQYLAFALIAVVFIGARVALAERAPNIVVILADDLGYGELGCYGGELPTPHIDALASQGVRFTSGYVSCPSCSPARAGLLTGRYQQRFGHEFNPGQGEQTRAVFGLPLSQVTLADRLKRAGYATGMVGKWHLGTRSEYHPTRRGFDEYFGFLDGAHPYLPTHPGKATANPILRGTEAVDEPEYLTDAFSREATAFVERHKDQPFFLYLPFNAVHAPLEATDNYMGRFAGIKDEKRRAFAAMLSALDDAVGAVTNKLRDAGLEDRTLIFFLSDNGGPTPQTTCRNDPLRGGKGTLWEGGTRIPFMVRWSGHVSSGKVIDWPVISLDILPTVLAAAGVETADREKLDGVDLLPYLTGRNAARPHEILYWRFGKQKAIRRGDLKLLWLEGKTPWLYDLAADISEKNDLAAVRPDIVKELMAAHQKWNADLIEPLWPPPGTE